MLVLALYSLLGTVNDSYAARVRHDVDRGADFTAVQTYDWHPEAIRDAALSPLMQKRLMDSVNAQLALRGLQRVADDPDVWVSVDTSQERGYRVSSVGYGGFGFGRRFGFGAFGGLGLVDTSVVAVDETVIAVDLWDAATTHPLWRGTVRDNLSERPKRNARQLDRGVRKVFRRFPVDGT